MTRANTSHLTIKARGSLHFIHKQYPSWILLHSNPTDEIRMMAARANGLALKYIAAENQTEQLCMEAIAQNILALQYVKRPTRRIYLFALSLSPLAIRLIK